MRERKSSGNVFLILSLLLAIVGVLFCSKSSPLYIINDKDDCNTFFILGKGIFNGKVPYRDLYEQKGPYIYLIYGIGYLLSHDSFVGVFVIEIIAMTVCFYWTAKTFELFLDRNVSLALVIFSVVPYLGCMWTTGGMAEEFMLPFISYTIYSLTANLKEERDIPMKDIFFYGIFASYIFWMKYSVITFYAAVMISILLYDFIKNSSVRRAAEISGVFLAGFFLMTLPVIIYFMANSALNDLVDTYFVNMFLNYDNKAGGFGSKLLLIFRTAFNAFAGNRNTLIRNALFIFLFLVGMIYIIADNRIKKLYKEMYILTVVLTISGIFYSGHYSGYYLLAVISMVIPGILFVLGIYNSVINNHSIEFMINLFAFLTFGALAIFIFNYERIKIPKEDLAQYKYAKIIKTKENPTLIDYGTTDWGFFITSGAEADFRYFSTQVGISEEVKNSQTEFVKKGIADFVITAEVDFSYGDVWEAADMSDMDKYKLVDTVEQMSGNDKYIFHLYSLKE